MKKKLSEKIRNENSDEHIFDDNLLKKSDAKNVDEKFSMKKNVEIFSKNEWFTKRALSRNNLLDIVKEVGKNIFIPMTGGGGIRSVDDAYKLLNAGADKVAINTAAVAKPKIIDSNMLVSNE